MRRWLKVLFLGCGLVCPISGWAGTASETLGNNQVIRLEPLAWDLTTVGYTYYDVMTKSGYTYSDYIVPTKPTSPQNYLYNFAETLNSGEYAGWLISTHANRQGWMMIEGYGGDAAGQAVQIAALQGYVSYLGSVGAVDVADPQHQGQFLVHGVGVNSNFCYSQWLVPNAQTFVDLRACESRAFAWAFTDNFRSDRVTFAGYTDTTTNGQIQSGIVRLYQNLGGVNGIRKRTLLNAIEGQAASWTISGNLKLTLAPAVTYCTPIPSDLTQRMTVRVNFDTKIDWPSVGSYIIRGEDAAYPYNVTVWNDTTLTFDLTGTAKNAFGQVYLQSDRTWGMGIRGWPAGTALDGNTNSGLYPDSPNGVYPNGDDYGVEFYSKLGDNPFAKVLGLNATAIDQGTQVAWRVESEQQTASYLVEQASLPTGPWTALQSVTATNQSSYMIWRPEDFPWYRLREIEMDGDTLTLAYASRQDPLTTRSEAIDTVAAAATLAELERRYLPSTTLMSLTTGATDAIFVPSAFLSPAQALASYKTSVGIPTTVYTLESIGGAANIKPMIASLVPNGLRNVLLIGDGNAVADVQGQSREGNPATLDSGYVAPGGTTPQPQLNLVPVGSYPMVWGWQADGMTYWTKYFASDWWYIDLDGDGLPDPGLAIGRLPAGTWAEATNAVNKQINAFQINPNASGVNHVYVHTYAFDVLGNSGAETIAYTDSLLQYVPAHRIVDRFTDSPNGWFTEPRRDSICIAQFNKGSALQIFKSTVNSRYHDAGCLDQNRHAPLNGFITNPYRLAFQYISSCGGADFDRSEVDSIGRPLGERLLENRSDLGSWGYFGPSRGSWQHGNHLMDREFLTRLYSVGSASVGQAAAMSVYQLAVHQPVFRDLALSYVLIGDPSVPLAGMKRVTLAVDDGPTGSSFALAVPQPNPVNSTCLLRFTVPQPSMVELDLFDAQGRRTSVLRRDWVAAGSHEYRLSTQPWSPGVYFIRLKVGAEQRIQKMVIVR